MQPIIKDINEITDSKEMYDAKPHPFLGIFIYLLLICIIIAFIWMYFGEIDIVSKGAGVVRPNENISMIRNKVQGEVTYVEIEEGQNVKKGDILFKINCEDLEIKKMQMKEIMLEKKFVLNQLIKLKDSITSNINLFSENDEKEYYDRYVKFLQDYEALKKEVLISSKNEDITIKQIYFNKNIYTNKIAELNILIEDLNLFKELIDDGENALEDKTSANSLAFDMYMYKLVELEQDKNNKKVEYDLNKILYNENLIAKRLYEDSKLSYELAENAINNYKISNLHQIESQLNEVIVSKQNYEQELAKLIIDNELINVNNEQRELSIDKFKTDTLVTLYNQIDEIELSYKSYKKDVESLDNSIMNSTIVAPIDGKINITNNISVGDLLTVGTDVATIIPNNSYVYKVEIFMPNREIASINEGDLLKYKFEALPYKEYGHLNGYITKISTDATVSNNVSGYNLQGSIENKIIYSYKNKPAEIKIGMICEVHVVTEQKKILFFLLEKINLAD